MSRTPVPAPARRARFPTSAGHLRGCVIAKRGRKNRFDSEMMVRMVDLCATGLSRREAAEKVSAEREGEPGAEALRKHFRSLERSGQLPASAPLAERKAEQIVERIRLFQAQDEESRHQRIALEQEAAELGLDLRDQRIGDLLKAIDADRDRLDTLVKQAPDWTASYYRQEGITDPDEVRARYLKAASDLLLREKQVDLLRRLRKFRPDFP